ncbi:Lrp/AsnC family transcriptional regulator [Kitasatospora acidiphila]|uniref:Lrp/AsnC family transcriptional regulator n=1 Tax=Kitasatospora acidiphila TaxID=2567942 RepID=A0A540W229_9ACTN|nr:Lrp/AsnC family transcriptional regulator [Kitasatospora acidiphila]TQF03079.1 Lrp/AsnC family transcriptional regulator [Kitasatospora acidiphila]
MDRIDRELLAFLLQDGRATYQELGRQVRLSANTVADRVRRLQAAGIIKGYRAELNLEAFGRGMQMISDIRLGDRVDRHAFERQLADVPQVISAMRLTGDYDFQLRVVCADAREFESVIDRLKADLGVRELRSRLVLHEVSLGLERVLEG